jgi:hypothetical protein
VIVTEEKPLEEILHFLEPYRVILVVGCQGCFQPRRGVKEAERYIEKLEAHGKEVRVLGIARQCDRKLVELTPKLQEHLEEVDAILSLGCGVGVQLLAEAFPHIPVFPAQNTMFIGGEPRAGELLEWCSACGDCVLDRTAGICPITRCPKSLLNGPCGGSEGGRCEVDPEIECAWCLIYQRLKERGRLDLLEEIWDMRDWSGAGFGGPRTAQLREAQG